MTTEQLQKAVDFAKKNPADPRAKELRRRIESGMLNPELESAGMKTFEPPKPPKIDMNKAMSGVKQEEGLQSTVPQQGRMSDAISDVGGTAQRFIGRVGERVSKVGQILEAGKGDSSIRGQLQKGYQIAGQAAGAVADAGGALLEGGALLALSPEQEQQVSEQGKALLATPGGQMAMQALQSGMETWEEFKMNNPDLAANLEATVNLASLFPIGAGARAVERGGAAVMEGVERAAPVVRDIARAGTNAVIDNAVPAAKAAADAAGDVAGKVVRGNAITEAGRVEQGTEAARRVLQGKPEDLEQGIRALNTIDTADIKTYKDLGARMDERVSQRAKDVDAILESDTTLRRPAELINRIEVKDRKGKVVSTTYNEPVRDAIKELSEYYTKTNDAAGIERMRVLNDKFEADGLTTKEVNDLARTHGQDLNAFNANGELASGLSKQAAENTRKGLKDVVRTRSKGTEEIDKEISDLKSTRDLVTKMEEKVNALEQKTKKRSLGAKIGGAAATTADVLTGGMLRGFVAKLIPRNAGYKTSNSLDLQEELSKNLARVDKLLEIKNKKKFDAEMAKFAKELGVTADDAPAPKIDAPAAKTDTPQAAPTAEAPAVDMPKPKTGKDVGSYYPTQEEAAGWISKNADTIADLEARLAKNPDISRKKRMSDIRYARSQMKKAFNEYKKFNPNAIDRDWTLPGKDLIVQEKSLAKYEANPEGLVDEYIATHGKIVNTDEARKLFADVGYNGLNAAAVQEASSAVAKGAYRRALAENPGEYAVLYAGGSGAGKSSISRLFKDSESGAAVVLDGNLSTLESADKRITEAVRAGKKVRIAYVYREPVDAWMNGVIKRMRDNKSEGSRVVPLRIFLQNHKGSHDVVRHLLNNPDIEFKLADNTLADGPGIMTLDKFNSIAYSEKELRSKLLRATKQEYKNGNITKEQYEALVE